MVAAVIGMLYSYRLGRRSESKLRGWLAGAVLTVVMAGVFNLATWGGAHLYGDRSPAVADISAAFGLTPGKEYPLQVGGRTGGAKVTATQAGDHFGYTATTGSSVAVSFVHNGTSWILNIPLEQITFVQKPDVSPTMSLVLNDGDTLGLGEKVAVHSGPCRFVVESGYAACKRHVTWRTVLARTTVRRGLPTIVANHLDSARFIVTPAMYQAILGGDKNG